MKTIKINYAYKKEIEVLVPRKQKNRESLTDGLISGNYNVFYVKIVDGLEEFIKHVVKNADDNNSNRGKWYAHCNAYCLDAIVDYTSMKSGVVQINTFREYRRSSKQFYDLR